MLTIRAGFYVRNSYAEDQIKLRMMYYSVMTQANSVKGNPLAPIRSRT